jgi:hypothetical protein
MIEKAELFQKYDLIIYLGFPILKIKTKEVINEDELKFIKNLIKVPHHNYDFKLSKSDNILNNKELKRIKEFIWEYFCGYVDNILEIENQFYMSNSWASIHKKGNFHPNHAHPNAIFSSVFYASVSAGSSKFIFTTTKPSIQEGFNFQYKVTNYNIFNSPSWRLPVEAGDLLIFPAHMQHESSPYDGDADRIMLGQSYFFRGRIGTEGEYNSLEL